MLNKYSVMFLIGSLLLANLSLQAIEWEDETIFQIKEDKPDSPEFIGIDLLVFEFSKQ